MDDSRTRGASPSATGGAGVSFAHRVASIYSTAMLTGARRTELGDQAPARISFQTGPVHPVDDLLIESAGTIERQSLAIACRLTPSFVRSHQATIKLLESLIRELAAFAEPTHEVAIAIAGWSTQYDEVQQLTVIARRHADAASFTASITTPGRFKAAVADRYDHLRDMVARIGDNEESPPGLGGPDPEFRTWALLARMHLLSFNVQDPDRTDWTSTATAMDQLAGQGVDGVTLLDELASRCSEYDAAGAVIDVAMLRRDVHGLLGATTERTSDSWRAMAEHETYAAAAVRRSLGPMQADTSSFAFEFPERRAEITERLRRAGENKHTLLITGPSGTGKSALVLEVLETLRTEPGFDAVVLNFRGLPETTFAFESSLGCSLTDLLCDLSAPRRLLIIDAADAAVERSSAMLADLASAARRSGVGVVAVSSDTAADFVMDQVTRSFGTAPETYAVPVLNDQEVSEVSMRLPALRGLLRNLGPASLLRRLVVLDLISRTGRTLDEPLGEWACLEVIWNGLVRRRGVAGTASPEAREHTMLAVAAADLYRAASSRAVPGASATEAAPTSPLPQPDHAAVDSLQRDHLLAPRTLRQTRLEFAHDELRRYATAILLVRAESITSCLALSRAPRWSLSAATLACKGQILDPQLSPESTFANLIEDFSALASSFGPRWADVPLEAVLDTPYGYRCLAAPLLGRSGAESSTTAEQQAEDGATGRRVLADLLRVVQQRMTVDGLVDVAVGEPVINLLADYAKPWDISDAAFEVLTGWLTALVVGDAPAGQSVRLRLRTKMLAYWARFPPREPDIEEVERMSRFGQRRRHRLLDYELTNEKLVETLALLGPDANDEVEQCLRLLASLAPGFLAPAVDSPLSARSIASYNVNLLADLIEAYYIDDTTDYGWRMHDAGIRMHQGRWTSAGPPFDAYWFGGFWVLFNRAPARLSSRVLNRILNHAAGAGAERRKQRSREASWLGYEYGDEPGPAKPSEGVPAFDAEIGIERAEDEHTVDFGLATISHRGDAHMWSWYRGTSVGPYPCLSALQAMERVAESWLLAGASAEAVVKALLHECENLAVPGMLFGLLTRHLEDIGSLIDPFLAEPLVWHAEFGRRTSEYTGWKASSEGLAHPERREWTPRETAMTMVLRADESRREELRALARKLIDNGRAQGLEESARNWATGLDLTYYKGHQTDEGYYITVEPPEDLRAAQERHASATETSNEVLRLQNLYWANMKQYKPDYTPPSDEQVATDLGVARRLVESDSEEDLLRPHEAAACVARTAVLRAADGRFQALGDHGDFAVAAIVEIAGHFIDGPNLRDEGQYYDLGLDRSAATALPALLSPVFDETLNAAGIDVPELAGLGDAIASRGPLETRLFLARGCDRIWTQPCCVSSPTQLATKTQDTSAAQCPHAVAFTWLLNSARDAAIGPWDPEDQRKHHVHIDGDLVEGLESLESNDVDLAVLDAVIRGMGSAASHQHCCTEQAQRFLPRLLRVQVRAMVAHETRGWTGDDRGHHTLVAARALLQTCDPAHPDALLAHLDALRTDAGLLTNFLHGLAAAGAETAELAATVRAVWPAIIDRALGYAEDRPNVFDDRTWGKWAASALLPEPLTWTQGIYNEPAAAPIDWVKAEDLVPFVESWLVVARGEIWCLNPLIRLIGRCPIDDQVTLGLGWVKILCMREEEFLASGTAASNDWLIGIRTAAEQRGYLEPWQSLVDAMVVAGNSALAPYST